MKKFKVFLMAALMALCMTGCGQTGGTDLFHSSSGGSSDTGSSDSSSSSSSSNPSTWEDEEEFWTDFY